MADNDELLKQDLHKILSNNIYRYRSLTRGLEMIETQELFLSSPDGFNDPFDCNEGLIEFKMTKEFIQEYITNHPAITSISSREQRRRIEKRAIENPKSLFDIDEFFKSQKRQFGICCFSWDCRNIVMWAHYADNHHGICFGFKNIPTVKNIFYRIYSVNYVSEIKKYPFTSFEDTGYWYHWLCTKSIMWSYEQEVRLISKSYNGILKFSKEAIGEVILGLSIEKEDEQKVIDLLVKHNYPQDTKLYKMVIDKKKFSLKFKEIKWKK